jgi:sugar lactone lactonase YvrE
MTSPHRSIRHLCSTALLLAALGVPAAELQPGLVGEYFTIDKPDTFPVIPSGRQPTYVRVDPRITFDEVTEGKFYGTKLSTNFYARWTGVIKIDKPGVYEFALISDDGSRLSIGGKTVVENGGVHAMQRKAGNIELAAGEHPIVIEFVQGGGGAGCVAWWTPPGGRDTPIPASALFHAKGAEQIAFDKAAWDKMPGDDPAVMTNEYGPFVTHTIEAGFPAANNYAYKGVLVKLSEDGNANLCFDTESLRVSCAWEGGYLKMPRARDGLEGHPKVVGEPAFGTLPGPGWAKGGNFTDPRTKGQGPLPADWAKWKGLYLDGRTVVLSYSVGTASVLESPSLVSGAFVRSFNLGATTEELTLLVAEEPGATVTVVGKSGVLAGNGSATGVVLRGGDDLSFIAGNGRLHLVIPASSKPRSFTLTHARGDAETAKAKLKSAMAEPKDLSAHTKGGAPRWGAALKTTLAEGMGDGAYVVDTITVPNDNPWKSYMRTSGFDFFADGRAAICTMDGDVWIVSDFARGQTPSWRRFATGMFQPLGVKVVDGKVHVLGREQLTVLHDLNNDGEADFYQNLNNDCVVTDNYHEFALDLQTDKAGNFFYAKGSPWPPNVTSPHQGCMMKVSKDGSKLEVYATGLRAPNGLGMGPNDELTFSDNQGHWMPACKVSWVKPGGFYGMVPAAHRDSEPKDFDKPLFWLPMSMDNSSGGEGWVKGDQWGPFAGQMLHTSYGKGTFFICYHEEVKGQMQGGAVKLPLNFTSGMMRIRQSPTDGQIYVVGMRGWQTNGSQPGAFQRVRYTGKPANLPKTIRTQTDAIAITFTDALAKDAATADNLAIEAWNYKWSGNYGSPEIKPSDGKNGHDTIVPNAVTLSPDGKTLTIGLPGLKPVDQLKIKYKLETAAGELAANEIYYTINAVP